MGYGAPASVGAGLAAKKAGNGRIVVNIQCDGDLNYAPGVLWTMAHHRLPVLTVMHNNRAWHQELMYAEGSITNPKDLGPAYKRALERVKRGEPALVDVVTQPR